MLLSQNGKRNFLNIRNAASINVKNSYAPGGNVPNVHLNAQDPGHHNHVAKAQPTQTGATTSPLHCSQTGQILLELHWRNHQIVLPKVPMNLGFPLNNPIQIPEHQTLKGSCIGIRVNTELYIDLKDRILDIVDKNHIR